MIINDELEFNIDSFVKYLIISDNTNYQFVDSLSILN
jgi:hypothetical protein